MKKLLIFSAKKYRPYFRRKHDTRILLWAKTTHFSPVAPSADLKLHNMHGGKCPRLKLQTFHLFREKIRLLFFENEPQKGRKIVIFIDFTRKSWFSSRNMQLRIFLTIFSESTRDFGSRKHLLIASCPQRKISVLLPFHAWFDIWLHRLLRVDAAKYRTKHGMVITPIFFAGDRMLSADVS